ncbi:hypothetical protein LTR12_004318 [Friedmanniomyces endolithicus]|nr:hypothetical protein LTR12_004318 [Friedmanniomyces endolithicus]
MLRAFAAASMTSTASPQLKQQPRPMTQPEAPQVAIATPVAPYALAAHNPAPYVPPPPRPATAPAGANPSSGIGMLATSTSPYRRAREASTQQHGTAFTPAHSLNQYVNGYSTYKFSPTGLLCTKCGVVGHIGPECANEPLSRLERDFLFNLTTFQREEGRARAAARMDGQLFNANLVSVEFKSERTAQVNEVEFLVLLEEGSNKRPRLEGDEVEPQTQTQCQHRGEGGDLSYNAGTCEHDCCKPTAQRPKKPLKKTMRPKVKKPLKPIVARTAEAPLDILAILKTASVTIDITQLAQLSPYFRDETKRLLSMPRQRRAKKGAAVAPATVSAVTFEAEVRQVMVEITQDIQEFCKKDRTNRAFSLLAKVWKTDKASAVAVARNRVAADQGSDINLIYPELQKRLGLELILTKKLQMLNMSMTVADGTKCYLDHYTVLNIEVSGIERSAWAFVCPTQTKNLDLLLGILYLSSVKAKIDISNNSIEIGDKKRDEGRVKVRTPEVKLVSPKITRRSEEGARVVEVEESSKDDEGDNDESSDDGEGEVETSDDEDTSEDEATEDGRDF